MAASAATTSFSQEYPITANSYLYLREWAPMTKLSEKLPHKVHLGLIPQQVKLTSIDAVPEYLALGTNLGIVYWFDRKTLDLQELRCEFNSAVTKVKIISTVEFMVAAGGRCGSISIFQIPKSLPDSIPDSLKPKTSKKIERYTVSELHKSEIRALEWSKNGMKLFSGDKSGTVVFTEIDFYTHICKSIEILNESYEVVQLSYNQQRLLVSTTYRSIICQKLDKWKVCQVGKKDRKLLGPFGGLILQTSIRPDDLQLCCTRPGLRIWLADVEGNVQKTLLFKDLLNKSCDEVLLINPVSRSLRALKPQKEPNFGPLLKFHDRLLITYNDEIVYILDHNQMHILYKMSHLRSVIDIASYKDEIFILEEDRTVVRISDRPENLDSSVTTSSNSSSPAHSIKAITEKINTSNIIAAIPPLFQNPFVHESQNINDYNDQSVESYAEEAKESPVKSEPVPVLNERKSFDEIGKLDYSETIIFKKSKRKKRGMSSSTMSISSTSSEEKEGGSVKSSTIRLLPDLRKPDDIRSDIENKEKILCDMLKLDKINISDSVSKCDESGSETLGKKESKPGQCITVRQIPESSKKVVDKCLPEPSTAKGNESSKSKRIDFGPKIDVSVEEKVRTNTENDVNVNVNRTAINRSIYRVNEAGSFNNSPLEINSSASYSTVNFDEALSSSLLANISDIPACVSIPNEWKLSEIQTNKKRDTSLSDNSLNDWEIV